MQQAAGQEAVRNELSARPALLPRYESGNKQVCWMVSLAVRGLVPGPAGS